MILIKEKEFEMIQVKESPFFNLSILTPINEGTDKERLEMKLIGYGMTFESCLQLIVHSKLFNRNLECTISEFISEYKKVTDEIIKLINYSDIEEETIIEEIE